MATTTTNTIDHAGKVHFHPKEHLHLQPLSKVYSLADLKYYVQQAVGSIAATDPFPLFTHEAVVEMSSELLSPRTVKNCMTCNRTSSVQIRGAAPQYAPFVYEAWMHPETLKAVSTVVGLPVKINLAQENAPMNVQLDEKMGLRTLDDLTPESREPKKQQGLILPRERTSPWIQIPMSSNGITLCIPELWSVALEVVGHRW